MTLMLVRHRFNLQKKQCGGVCFCVHSISFWIAIRQKLLQCYFLVILPIGLHAYARLRLLFKWYLYVVFFHFPAIWSTYVRCLTSLFSAFCTWQRSIDSPKVVPTSTSTSTRCRRSHDRSLQRHTKANCGNNMSVLSYEVLAVLCTTETFWDY